MPTSRMHWWVPTTAVLVTICAAIAKSVPFPGKGYQLSLFGNGLQVCLLLLLSLVLLRNAASTRGNTRYFWASMSFGSVLWLAATALWMWFEVVLKKPVPVPFVGDVLFFIHIVPMMGALAIRPHRVHSLRRLDFGTLDFAMLLLWWIYMYCFVVLPWQYVLPDVGKYATGFRLLYTVENAVLLFTLIVLCIRVRGPWRHVYGLCLVAAATYMLGSQLANTAIARGNYYSGSLYDIPLVVSMCMFVYMGLVSYKNSDQPMAEASPRVETAFVSVLAMLSVLSLPIIAAWGTFISDVPPSVRVFRLEATGFALFVLPTCVFLKQHLLGREMVRLLGASQRNFGNLKRLQTQLVQSEKLASIGELVAGAAHQISNPLTAIIGYSDLLTEDFPGEDDHANWIRKIGQQARRTQDLLKQLLTFAKQDPAQKQLTDINRVVADAVELRELDLDDQSIRIIQHLSNKLPHLWADGNQLLQVCFHIIGNAIDAMKPGGGGVLTITSRFENGSAVLEFSDTGTGVADPQRIFDPFYTTKPVGQGAGLGLSACYGIVTEHGGTIVCHDRPDGGATFTLRFPISYPPGKPEEAVESARA